MTMKIDVKNDDQDRVATVVEEEYEIGNLAPFRINKYDLNGGESRSFWIHASKRLIIGENPNASKNR